MFSERIDPTKPITDTIPEYFSGKNLFVTGFTGFLGKFHVAKLLTECPNIGTIYVLMRATAKKGIQQRLEDTLENMIFHELKKSNPDRLKKIVPIEGDLMIPNLGISEENRKFLINNVNIVYHIAATVRFDIPLTDAILLNVRGTRDLCHLVLEMKKCVFFAHVSTAYCHLENKTVEEKLYPSPVYWKDAIEIAENMDKFTVSILCRKYSDGYPNTYTFTKAIAEEVVSDLCEKKIPYIIFRPTIVGPSMDGIYPGWVDNFNGPIGLVVAQTKGIIRVAFGGEDCCYDLVPVDFVINNLIKATWIQQYLRKDEAVIYNSSRYDYERITLGSLIEHGKLVFDKQKINPIWHTDFYMTGNWLVYFINTVFFHVIPGIFIDIILRACGRKPMFVKLQRRVYIAAMAVNYFLLNAWDFLNHNCEALDDYVQPSDKEAFACCLSDLNIPDILLVSSQYIKIHMLKEKDCTVEEVKRKQVIFTSIHYAIKYTAISLFSWWFIKSIALPSLGYLMKYWASL